MLFRFASAAALAASLSMAATPLSAAELPQLAGHRAVEAPGVFDADAGLVGAALPAIGPVQASE